MSPKIDMNVCFIFSNRAESSILSPFINYFKLKSHVAVLDLSKEIRNLHLDINLHKVYLKCYQVLSSEKFDYVCILGDRRELPFISLASFLLGVKIVHIGAGEYTQGLPTIDQYIRPIVSILSDYQITFSRKAKDEVSHLFSGISNLKPKAYFFGNPVFRNTDIKKIKRIIRKNYDMVLIHPQSLSRKETLNDVNKIKKLIKNKKTIFIFGNKDKNSDIIENFYMQIKNNKNYVFFQSLPKKKYFSLVKYCDNFYTNSSSISEIKFLNKSCLQVIGRRNKNRSESVFKSKAPELLFTLLHNNR